MNRQFVKPLLIIFSALELLTMPLSVAAHGDEAHIELSAAQAQPDTTIDLRGAGFEPDSTITIMLLGAERQLILSAVTASAEGDVAQVLPLPADLIPGAYEVRAADSHHSASAPLTIVPDISAEENEQRDESEPLLTAFPASTSLGALTNQSAPQTTPQVALNPAPAPTNTAVSLWPLALLGALACGAIVIIARRKH